MHDPERCLPALPAGTQRVSAPPQPPGAELESLVNALQEIDACVLHSPDGASRELLRACSTGRAVILLGPADPELELVDGRDVLIAPDAAAACRAVESLRDDPVLRRRLGLAAQAWVEQRRAWSLYLDGYRELLDAALDDLAAPSPQPAAAASRSATSSPTAGRGAAAA